MKLIHDAGKFIVRTVESSVIELRINFTVCEKKNENNTSLFFFPPHIKYYISNSSTLFSRVISSKK